MGALRNVGFRIRAGMSHSSTYERMQMNFQAAVGDYVALLMMFFVLLAGLVYDATHHSGRMPS